MVGSILASDPYPIAAQSSLVFTGEIPAPLLRNLYRYSEVRDEPPSSGPALKPVADDHDIMAAPMATWISSTPHTRPFWRDPVFVAEFGRATRAELRAAVTEMWRRAEDAARAAPMPIAWSARLPNPEIERTTA
jgi:hypothetical protein